MSDPTSLNQLLTESYLQRFSGIGRLYGMNELPKFAKAHFVVVGINDGVGEAMECATGLER